MALAGAGTSLVCGVAQAQIPVAQTVGGVPWPVVGVISGIVVGVSSLLLQIYFSRRRRQEERDIYLIDMQIKALQLKHQQDMAALGRDREDGQ